MLYPATSGDRKMSSAPNISLLYKLAHLYGILTDYFDITGKCQQASEDALLAVLMAMGAPVSGIAEVHQALREREQTLWQCLLDPVTVVWEDAAKQVEIRLPARMSDSTMDGYLELETGERQTWKWASADLPVRHSTEIEGTKYLIKTIPLPDDLPLGYHHLTLQIQGKTAQSMLIAAPRKAYQPSQSMRQGWGVFLPLYALRSKNNWGIGDFSDLERLVDWIAGMGGNMVATLPLFATLPCRHCSPYAPVSRLMWNELYVDVERAAGLEKCPGAQSIISSPSFQSELDKIRTMPLVDYPAQIALKRPILEELCRCCFSGEYGCLNSLHSFAEAHPEVEDYARFRAAGERYGTSWQTWHSLLRDGTIKEGDYDEEAKRYHLYAQWLASQQMELLAKSAQAKNTSLYLDLPLGVHPDGYDVWRNRELFALQTSGGAPPDSFFTLGQNWGFPPLHPERLREHHYRYYIACLRHTLRHAGILRIDHVMSLHRLFWVPTGMKASQGVYVKYHSEELYAILALESQRHRAVIVGEDLGTVPQEVRPSMEQHGLHRMYVAQFEITPHTESGLNPVEPGMVASLNTHDMPTFAAFWQGLDIGERVKLGLLDDEGEKLEREKRSALKKAVSRLISHTGITTDSPLDAGKTLEAILGFLSRSAAFSVLVNLEDLWLEMQPQNTPGTVEECTNWQRKAQYAFEELSVSPEVTGILKEINRQRR